MATIRCTAVLEEIGTTRLVRLPQAASDQLSSRGMVMVGGTLNGAAFQTPLEPDGKRGHWLPVGDDLYAATGAVIGSSVTLEIEPSAAWPEPDVPADLQAALRAEPNAYAIWQDITPMARWDWIRWVRSTKQPATRQRRVEVTCSKLMSAKRRPCCFDRAQCSDPYVSTNGILLEAGTN